MQPYEFVLVYGIPDNVWYSISIKLVDAGWVGVVNANTGNVYHVMYVKYLS